MKAASSIASTRVGNDDSVRFAVLSEALLTAALGLKALTKIQEVTAQAYLLPHTSARFTPDPIS